MVQVLPTEGGNMVDRCCCRVGSRIIQHTRTPVSELLAPSPHHLRGHDIRTIHLQETAMDACRARTIQLSCL
jgi:hypothetical protein